MSRSAITVDSDSHILNAPYHGGNDSDVAEQDGSNVEPPENSDKLPPRDQWIHAGNMDKKIAAKGKNSTTRFAVLTEGHLYFTKHFEMPHASSDHNFGRSKSNPHTNGTLDFDEDKQEALRAAFNQYDKDGSGSPFIIIIMQGGASGRARENRRSKMCQCFECLYASTPLILDSWMFFPLSPRAYFCKRRLVSP